MRNATLSLQEIISANGSSPVAVAQEGSLVYVLDTGGQVSVSGYRLTPDGRLQIIANSTTFLTTFAGGSQAASLSISPNGQFLLVTERVPNQIDAFPINADGSLGAEVSTPSVGRYVFSVLFAPNGLFAVVTEITGASTSAVTSFAQNAGGSLEPVSSGSTNVSTDGAAACWNVFTPNGDFMYVSNSGSSTIAGFSINAASGELAPLTPTVVGDTSSGGNLDIAVTSDAQFFYSIDSGSGTISGFGIGSDGLLTPATTEISGLPQSAGSQGIAAY